MRRVLFVFRVCFVPDIGLLSVMWVFVGMLVSGIVVVLLLVWFASASCRPRFSRYIIEYLRATVISNAVT